MFKQHFSEHCPNSACPFALCSAVSRAKQHRVMAREWNALRTTAQHCWEVSQGCISAVIWPFGFSCRSLSGLWAGLCSLGRTSCL